jgi:hypothetical protein
MAWDGSITYMSIPYGQINWDTSILSPFSGFDGEVHSLDDRVFELKGEARKVLNNQASLRDCGIRFDGEDDIQKEKLRCVVLGSEEPISSDKHYVLIIAEAGVDDQGKMYYERVGAGALEQRQFADDSEQVRVR